MWIFYAINHAVLSVLYILYRIRGIVLIFTDCQWFCIIIVISKVKNKQLVTKKVFSYMSFSCDITYQENTDLYTGKENVKQNATQLKMTLPWHDML